MIINKLSAICTTFRQITKVLFIERRMPWKLQRLANLIIINGLRSIITTLRFLIKKPKYRIVVSSIYFGGIGGTEKDLMSLVESMDECLFFIQADNINCGGFVPATYNYYLNLPIPTKRLYDLYYYYAGGGHAKYLGSEYNFKAKVINTNTNNIRPLEQHFDHILIMSENYADFCNQHNKRLLAFPEVKLTFPKHEKTIKIPDVYYITVFNPFSGKQKGYELFLKAADNSCHPIVWCFNNKTKVQHDTLPDHPNIIKMPNLAQEELFYAYKNAKALVSFSSYESFGWVLAEAFFCGIPIISRKTGFLDYVANQKGIYIYNSEDELIKLLNTDTLEKKEYYYGLFIDNSYKKIIEKLLIEK